MGGWMGWVAKMGLICVQSDRVLAQVGQAKFYSAQKNVRAQRNCERARQRTSEAVTAAQTTPNHPNIKLLSSPHRPLAAFEEGRGLPRQMAAVVAPITTERARAASPPAAASAAFACRRLIDCRWWAHADKPMIAIFFLHLLTLRLRQ